MTIFVLFVLSFPFVRLIEMELFFEPNVSTDV